MNIDKILQALNDQQVDYMLIGGMNFLIRHLPELTYDVDVWVEDSDENLPRVNRALQELKAEWGPTDTEWKPVTSNSQWLRRQSVFCLTTQYGALDIFRDVLGLEGKYAECKARSVSTKTASGIPFFALADADMLAARKHFHQENRKPGEWKCYALRSTEVITVAEGLKKLEERKRDANYDPLQRWLHIQEATTWAEANMPPHLRRNRPRQPKWLPPNETKTV